MQHGATDAQSETVDRLVTSGRAGWANVPAGSGSVLVERATGCVLLSSDGDPITRPQEEKFPSAIRFDKGKFRDHAGFFEGVVPYMYLDTKGNVTVGIGHLLENADEAKQLPFFDRQSRKRAHRVHVENAFNKVRRNLGLAKEGHPAFKDLTHIDLDLTAVEALFDDDVRSFVSELIHTDGFTEFETYPALVQLGILDLAFNLGLPRFVDLFEQFQEALSERNWIKVADESRRTEVDEEGNIKEGVQNRNNVVQGWFLLAINEEPFFVNPDCSPKQLPVNFG